MAKRLTEKEIEEEINRLSSSEAVKLARKEQRIRYKKRQYLYTLRNLEKRGFELMELGVTLEELDLIEKEMEAASDKVH